MCVNVCMCVPINATQSGRERGRERERERERDWEKVSGCSAGQWGGGGGAHLQSAKQALPMWSHNC